MNRRELRIRVDERLDADTAAVLGAKIQYRDEHHELLFEYVDQAQLTGLLIQLADLHISYSHIEIDEIESWTSRGSHGIERP